MSKVFYFDYSKNKSILSGMETLCQESSILKILPKGGPVAVKLHMGEVGNVTYIRPAFVRRVVDLVKQAGGKPFVTDTTALYPGGRETEEKYLSTAAYNGFVEAGLGAPVVIADGDGYDGVTIPLDRFIEGCAIKDVEIAAKIDKASFLLVLSHVKGHMMSGLGGAIKNLAMGCVTKKSKSDQHLPTNPVLDYSKCTGCGDCIEICPVDAITLVDGKHKRNEDKCFHCSSCLFSCPANALYWKDNALEEFQVCLGHAASGVFQRFKGRIGFINFVQDLTLHCDCASPSGKAIVPDIGILASLDPVAIDKASMDLIDQSSVILSRKRVSPPDIFGKIHNIDSQIHINTAQRLGMGSTGYKLISV